MCDGGSYIGALYYSLFTIHRSRLFAIGNMQLLTRSRVGSFCSLCFRGRELAEHYVAAVHLDGHVVVGHREFKDVAVAFVPRAERLAVNEEGVVRVGGDHVEAEADGLADPEALCGVAEACLAAVEVYFVFLEAGEQAAFYITLCGAAVARGGLEIIPDYPKVDHRHRGFGSRDDSLAVPKVDEEFLLVEGGRRKSRCKHTVFEPHGHIGFPDAAELVQGLGLVGLALIFAAADGDNADDLLARPDVGGALALAVGACDPAGVEAEHLGFEDYPLSVVACAFVKVGVAAAADDGDVVHGVPEPAVVVEQGVEARGVVLYQLDIKAALAAAVANDVFKCLGGGFWYRRILEMPNAVAGFDCF